MAVEHVVHAGRVGREPRHDDHDKADRRDDRERDASGARPERSVQGDEHGERGTDEHGLRTGVAAVVHAGRIAARNIQRRHQHR